MIFYIFCFYQFNFSKALFAQISISLASDCLRETQLSGAHTVVCWRTRRILSNLWPGNSHFFKTILTILLWLYLWDCIYSEYCISLARIFQMTLASIDEHIPCCCPCCAGIHGLRSSLEVSGEAAFPFDFSLLEAQTFGNGFLILFLPAIVFYICKKWP